MDKSIELQILELKSQVFDILAQQEMLQGKINQMNEQKGQLLGQLRVLVAQQQKELKPS
jgi:hypothetical protein